MMKKLSFLIVALTTIALAHAQSATEGTLVIGDYDGATAVVEGSFWDSTPTTFYLAHTGSQIIYTADDLAGLAGLRDVKINKLTYRFTNQSGYYDIARNVKVYLQMIDQTAFSAIEGVKQFFDFDATAPSMAREETYELAYSYGDDGELEFVLSTPFDYTPGRGLLVTVVMDALDDDNCLDSSFDLQFYNAGVRNRAMTYTNNHVSFLDYKDTEDFPDAKSTLGCGTSIDLPVTKIGYTCAADDALRGDVNGDGAVDIADINVLINIMLGRDNAENYAGRAFVTDDETIDVADINAVINIMLSK